MTLGRARRRFRPGRDPHAVRHPGPSGRATADGQHVVVVGGGIAGIAAATGLAERGVRVDLVEQHDRLGGRVRAWRLPDGRTMSRGFHAFFRQYYNLRALLRRTDPELSRLVPMPDYPLISSTGMADSFAAIPRTPPLNLAGFVARSPSLTAGDLTRIHLPTALELIMVDFPASFAALDGISAADFLDRLRFPAAARHLALEVFARSFFADPREFSAGELVAMFHTYFTGSAEGLLFDVPDDDYDTTLWRPLGDHLQGLGVTVHTGTTVSGLRLDDDRVVVDTDGAGALSADAMVLAADPRASRSLIAGLDDDRSSVPAEWTTWRAAVAAERNAPTFVVWRLWLDRPAGPERPGFLGATGYDGLDNISVLNRFEAGAARWAARTGGAVVELHAYATGDDAHDRLRVVLREGLDRVYPELASATVLEQEWLAHDDCALIPTTPWAQRPGVITPDPRITLAGDWLRTNEPVALMERAATTGFAAANALLAHHGVAGHDLWTVPMQGLLAPRRRAS